MVFTSFERHSTFLSMRIPVFCTFALVRHTTRWAFCEIQPADASTWQFLKFTPVFNTCSPYALWGSWPTPMKAKLQNANLKSFVVRESQFRLFSIKFREKAV
jgi:hypothetical protein